MGGYGPGRRRRPARRGGVWCGAAPPAGPTWHAILHSQMFAAANCAVRWIRPFGVGRRDDAFGGSAGREAPRGLTNRGGVAVFFGGAEFALPECHVTARVPRHHLRACEGGGMVLPARGDVLCGWGGMVAAPSPRPHHTLPAKKVESSECACLSCFRRAGENVKPYSKECSAPETTGPSSLFLR